MSKIKNIIAYKIKSPLSLSDFAVGTNNVDGIPGFALGQTISIGLEEMRELFLAGLSPETGGTLKISEIVPTTILTSISAVANAISPAYTVQRYELVAIDLNGVIYILKQQNITFGIGQDALTDSDFIKLTSIVSKGTGQQMVSYNSTLKQYEVLTIDSETLTKTVDADGLHLEIPSTSSIPALYVNSLYIPSEAEFLAGNTKGEGTLAKPFTNTITAYVAGVPTITPNTAIQNALDAYVGTGTRLAPQKIGQKIIIQSNNGSGYTTSEDFSYNGLYLKCEESVYTTTTDWVIDMDNPLYFPVNNSRFVIEIAENKFFDFSQSIGFRNSGNTDNTAPPFQTQRVGGFLGGGVLYTAYNGVDVLSRYVFNGEGNNNDSSLHFDVRCKVLATNQGIYKTKNLMRIDFYNQVQSGLYLGTTNLALKAFHMEGGQIRFYEKGAINISAETSGRTYGCTFEPIGAGIGNTNFQLNSAKVAGNCNYAFAKLNNEAVTFLAFNSPSGDGFSTTLPGSPTPMAGLFQNLGATPWQVDFKNNVFSFTGVDFTKVDFTKGNTTSAVNFIGGAVLENLVTKNSRAQAIADGLPLYSAYIKTLGTVYPNTSQWERDIVLPA